MGSCRSSRPSGMHAIPARRRVCCKRFVPAHQRPRPAPDGSGEDASTQAGSLRHGERLQPDLTQGDMWVMYSPAGAGEGGGVSQRTARRSTIFALATCDPHAEPDVGALERSIVAHKHWYVLGACASGELTTRNRLPCSLPAGDCTHESVRDSGSHIPAPSEGG